MSKAIDLSTLVPALDDTQEFVVPLLDEEGDAPRLLPDGMTEVYAGDPKTRRLRALAGANNPYVFVVATPEGTNVDFSGIEPADLPAVLQELIDGLVA